MHVGNDAIRETPLSVTVNVFSPSRESNDKENTSLEKCMFNNCFRAHHPNFNISWIFKVFSC